MDYKEKVRVAEAALAEVEAGTSMEDIKTRLQHEGYQTDDFYAISGSLRKQLDQKYESKIMAMLEEGREPEIATAFQHLPQ